MNFCSGESILELLARIGEWHQNLSEKTAHDSNGRSNHTHTEDTETDSGFNFHVISILVVSIFYLRMESVHVCPQHSCQKRWNFDEIFSCYFFISWMECKTPLTFVHNILPVDITLNEAYMWDNILL